MTEEEEAAFDLEPTPGFWQILRSPAVPSVIVTSFLMMFVNQVCISLPLAPCMF